MKDRIATLLLALLPMSLWGQSWTPVSAKELVTRLERSAAQYNAMANYRVRSSIMAYRNIADAEPTETETSTVWKQGDMVKAEHMGLVSFQNSKLRVTVVPEERVLMVAEPQEHFDVLGPDYRSLVLNAAKSVERSEQAGRISYRVRYPKGGDYEQLLFSFDEGAWLRRVECWWGHSVAVAPDVPLSASMTPKVVLEMERPIRIEPGTVQADPANAVVLKDHDLAPTAAYSGYEIVDNRLNP